MAIGVNTAVKAVEAPIAHPIPHTAVAQTSGGKLIARDNTPLAPRNLSQSGLGVFPGHMPR